MKKIFDSSKLVCPTNNYLSNCDLLNKYRLKSVYSQPKLEKIVLSFSFKEFLNGFENSKNNLNHSSLMEIKAFLVFYLCFSIFPFLSFNVSSMSRTHEKTDNGDFVFKIVITDKKIMQKFLFEFWINNFSQFKTKGQLLQSITKTNLKNFDCCYSLSLNAKSLSDFEDVIEAINSDKDSEFRDFNLKINFIFGNFESTKDSYLSIKNLPLFWING